MMGSLSASAPPADTTYYNVPPTNRDYYNVNAVDQSSYGQLSDVANDSHTYDQLRAQWMCNNYWLTFDIIIMLPTYMLC